MEQDELVIKIISILLLQPFSFSREPVNKPKKLSSFDTFKLKLSPLSPIKPPILYSTEAITLECKQLLQTIQSVFEIEPEKFKAQVDVVAASFRPDALFKDALVYQQFLSSGFICDVGLADSPLKKWTAGEEDWAVGTIKKSESTNVPYFQVSGQTSSFLITVVKAGNLKAKDTKTSNNTYPFVTFREASWVGPTIDRSLNPSFDHSLSLCFPPNSTDPITISLWNRPVNPEKTDSFLGCVHLTPTDIVRLSATTQHAELPLEKRTKKSHVSGYLSILVRPLLPQFMDLKTMYQKGLGLIISDPKINYRKLCKSCFEWSFLKTASKEKNSLAPVCRRILEIAIPYWRISSTYASLCSLEVAYSLFCQGCVSVDFLYAMFVDTFDKFSMLDSSTVAEVSVTIYFSNLHSLMFARDLFLLSKKFWGPCLQITGAATFQESNWTTFS
jgi:C2 domain